MIGYTRVSTTSQNLDLQMDALKKAGCEKIFEDTQSGARGLDESLAFLRPGDVLSDSKFEGLIRPRPAKEVWKDSYGIPEEEGEAFKKSG